MTIKSSGLEDDDYNSNINRYISLKAYTTHTHIEVGQSVWHINNITGN